MKGLENVKFKAISVGTGGEVVEGKLTLRDKETLNSADENVDNGNILCIENERGVHMVIFNTIELAADAECITADKNMPVTMPEINI